jgi:hypothetical protein
VIQKERWGVLLLDVPAGQSMYGRHASKANMKNRKEEMKKGVSLEVDVTQAWSSGGSLSLPAEDWQRSVF